MKAWRVIWLSGCGWKACLYPALMDALLVCDGVMVVVWPRSYARGSQKNDKSYSLLTLIKVKFVN